jgi:hypothetical protein
MAASKKDVIRLTDDDFKAKSFKVAPGGRYQFKPKKADTKIKPGTESNIFQAAMTISSGPHKGIEVFDNIAAHVGWKIAQLLLALGIPKKKVKKGLTLQDVMKLFLASKGFGAVIKKQVTEEFGKQNKVIQYLPPGASASDDEDEDIDESDDDEDLDEDTDSDDEEDEDEDDSDDSDDEDEDEDDDSDDEDEDEDDSDDSDDEDEDEDDDSDDEDEDEDDEPPTRRTVAKKKSVAKKPVAKKKTARR